MLVQHCEQWHLGAGRAAAAQGFAVHAVYPSPGVRCRLARENPPADRVVQASVWTRAGFAGTWTRPEPATPRQRIQDFAQRMDDTAGVSPVRHCRRRRDRPRPALDRQRLVQAILVHSQPVRSAMLIPAGSVLFDLPKLDTWMITERPRPSLCHHDPECPHPTTHNSHIATFPEPCSSTPVPLRGTGEHQPLRVIGRTSLRQIRKACLRYQRPIRSGSGARSVNGFRWSADVWCRATSDRPPTLRATARGHATVPHSSHPVC